MKRSKLTTFTVIVLLITMIALIMVSGTYAKYTTEVTGEDTAIVAKFDVDGLTTFNLFDTINDTKDGNDETDVADERIAPGTEGYFEIALENKSEVSVEYELKLAETKNSDIPIEYSTDGETYYTAEDFINASTASGTLGIDSNTTTTVGIYWQWVFEGGTSNVYTTQTNEDDTAIGKIGNDATVTVTATATFTQID